MELIVLLYEEVKNSFVPMNNESCDDLFGVVLAAGRSSRLGRPKQLIEFKGTSLLAHAIRNVERVVGDRHVVVLGSNWEALFDDCADDLRFFIINTRWADGLSSSLQAACRSVPDHANGVLVTVTDQPYIDAAHLRQLKRVWLSDRARVVASGYRNGPGVPAIIPIRLFDAIGTLSGDTGARALFREHPDRIVTVNCPAAETDVDTPEDLKRLLDER